MAEQRRIFTLSATFARIHGRCGYREKTSTTFLRAKRKQNGIAVNDTQRVGALSGVRTQYRIDGRGPITSALAMADRRCWPLHQTETGASHHLQLQLKFVTKKTAREYHGP